MKSNPAAEAAMSGHGARVAAPAPDASTSGTSLGGAALGPIPQRLTKHRMNSSLGGPARPLQPAGVSGALPVVKPIDTEISLDDCKQPTGLISHPR